MSKCLNCGYESLEKDDQYGVSLSSECPKCHVIYEKDDRMLLKKEYEEAEKWVSEKEKRKEHLGAAGQSQEQNVIAPQSSSSMNKKNCPYCAEKIKADAVKCRYCGEWLDSLPTRTANAIINTVSKDVKNAKYDDTGRIPIAGKSFTGWIFIIVGGLIGSLVTVLILFGLMGKDYHGGFGGRILGLLLIAGGAWAGRVYHESIKRKLEKQKPSPSIKLPVKSKSSDVDESDSIETVSKENDDIAKKYFHKGVNEFDSGNYEQAIVDYTEAIKLKPDYFKAYTNRGVTYYRINRKVEAINDWKMSSRLGSKVADAHLESLKRTVWGRMSPGTKWLIVLGVILFVGIIFSMIGENNREALRQQAIQKQRIKEQVAQTQARVEAQEEESERLLRACKTSCMMAQKSPKFKNSLDMVNDNTIGLLMQCSNKCEQDAMTRNVEIGTLREMQKQHGR